MELENGSKTVKRYECTLLMFLQWFFRAELLHIAGITTLQTPNGSSPLGPSSAVEQRSPSVGGEDATRHASDILDSTSFELKLDKSNILMLGPTGTGYNGIFMCF